MPVSAARAAAFDILLRVERQSAYASELLHAERVDKLDIADRGLTTELVMGVLRWRSQLDEAIVTASSRPLARLDLEVVIALRLTAYQLRYLTRIPARAAINEGVESVKRAKKRSAVPFANAVLRKIAGDLSEASAELPEITASSLARAYAHPAWLVERWVNSFGIERTRLICDHDQRVPATALRLESASDESELLRESVELAPGALLSSARIVVNGDVTQSLAFRDGRVFVQDEASQLVATLVGNGSRILDCCAAPGGKTAVIASQNLAAEIIATELHPHRAELLRRRVRATNVEVIAADVLQLPMHGGFDRVLADVSCSGTGTLARNPEIKWRLTLEDLSELHSRQVAILRAALAQLARGGRAVYSTCSLEREENEAVVHEVLRDLPEFHLRDCREDLESLRASGNLAWSDLDSLLSGKFLRTLPGVHPCDGFFAAMIERE